MKIRIMEPMQEVKQKKKRVCAYARVSTVSYTHLDVYKRQILNSIFRISKSMQMKSNSA